MTGTDRSPHPAIGDTVRDPRYNRIGIVTDRLGPYLQLRPLTGGREWDADPDHVEPATPPEVLRARLAEVNARSLRRPPNS
ncbi:hypothetical protein ACFVHW_03495 [Streptomyces sp. NPDC127110]|uniref:hypothetical protein n=1 Tax=Streptomyces sp. NPDC127110 TaxID=3345362 RepID=UPI00362D1C39